MIPDCVPQLKKKIKVYVQKKKKKKAKNGHMFEQEKHSEGTDLC